MQKFEYKAVAAPNRGEKGRGMKTTADRFANALTHVMNDMAREGWEYLRADTLPCEERSGLTSRTISFQHVLVFRRLLTASIAERPALPLPAPIRAPEPVAYRATATEGAAPRNGPAEPGSLAAE